MLFGTLWNSEDFFAGANNLAHEYRDRQELPPLFQLGLTVTNVEVSASQLEVQGVGPFLIMDGPAKRWRERGEELHFRGKMGLAFYKGIQLELLEPGEGSDFYRQCLDPAGAIKIHHLGFAVNDIEKWSKQLASRGSPILVQGGLAAGPLTVDFAYLDTIAQTGFVMEFLCWRLFNIPFRLPQWVAHGIGRLEKFSGKRSLTV